MRKGQARPDRRPWVHAWVDCSGPRPATISGLVRRKTRPHVRQKQGFTGRSEAQARFPGWSAAETEFGPRGCAHCGQVEPSEQLKAVHTVHNPGLALGELTAGLPVGSRSRPDR